MDQALQLVTLGVADVARSRRFYVDGLGWRPLVDAPEVVFFQVGHGTVLALFSLADLGADVGTPAEPGSSITLARNVDSAGRVDELVELARAAGATVLKEPQRAVFGGRHAYVADPDGHRWEVAWNPGWSVAADGTVSLVSVDDE
jgi:catechol 2,3-dioxygenase-like lactoylglutathione lyase family enzyme